MAWIKKTRQTWPLVLVLSAGLLVLEPDEKSGGYVIKSVAGEE